MTTQTLGQLPAITYRPRWLARTTLTRLFILWVLNAPAAATDLVVQVRGLTPPLGQFGCSLLRSGEGFSLDNRRAEVQWLPAQPETASCHCAGLEPGRYAVAVAHDRNGSRRVGSNFLGMPTEPWRVSNNVRPTLHAPTYEEASFTRDGTTAEPTLQIKVAP